MKKSFIPLTALALFALVSCKPAETPTSSSESESVSQAVVNSVTISNKEALANDWHLEDEDRTMNITLDPAGNVTSLINSGALTITSSDATVISVSGKVLKALKQGSATITVAYGGKSDSVTIEVKAKRNVKELYGVDHFGTEEDPFTNEDAIKVAEAVGETETSNYFYVKGEVAAFTDVPSSYGNVSYYLKAATDGGKKFIVYRAKKLGSDGSTANVTEDDIWVGATATAKVKIVNYKDSIPESSSGGSITKVEGTKPAVEEVASNVADALAYAKSLEAGTYGVKKYTITGYITKVTSKGYYLSDTKGAEADEKEDLLVYGYKGTNADDCTKGAKIKVTALLQYYRSTSDTTNYNYQTGKIYDDIEILEAGEQVVFDPLTTTEAIAKATALENGKTTDKKYEVTGFVAKVDYDYADGVMTFEMVETLGTTTYLQAFKVSMAEGVDYTKITWGAKVTVRSYLKKFKSGETITLELEKGTVISVTETAKQTSYDPLTVAGATTKANELDAGAISAVKYEIEGYVVKVTYAYSYAAKNISFTLSDTKGGTDTITVTKAIFGDGIDCEKNYVGAKIKLHANLEKYTSSDKTYIRVSYGSIISVDETDAASDYTVTTATVAQAITDAKALKNNNDLTTGKYEVTGYVTSIKSAYEDGVMSFYMSDTMDDPSATFIAYNVAVTQEVANTIKSGAQVKVTSLLTKYNSTYETASGNAKVSVVAAPVGMDITASIDKQSIDAGTTATITATAEEDATFTYASSNDAVATVTNAGVVTGVAEGKATITIASSKGRKAYVTVEVVEPLAANERKVTWTVSTDDGLPTTASATVCSFTAKFGNTDLDMGGSWVRSNNYNGVISLFMDNKNSLVVPYIYSKAELPGVIKSVEILTASNASGSAKYEVTFGTSTLSTATSNAGTKVGAGTKHKWTATSTDATYFQVASTNTGSTKNASYNGNIASIAIIYTVNA